MGTMTAPAVGSSTSGLISSATSPSITPSSGTRKYADGSNERGHMAEVSLEPRVRKPRSVQLSEPPRSKRAMRRHFLEARRRRIIEDLFAATSIIASSKSQGP